MKSGKSVLLKSTSGIVQNKRKHLAAGKVSAAERTRARVLRSTSAGRRFWSRSTLSAFWLSTAVLRFAAAFCKLSAFTILAFAASSFAILSLAALRFFAATSRVLLLPLFAGLLCRAALFLWSLSRRAWRRLTWALLFFLFLALFLAAATDNRNDENN